MDKFKIIVTLLAVVVLSVLFLLIKPDNVKSSKVVVSLSTFSLYDIARHIAEDDIELVMILPFGVDAHSYEPTPKQVAQIYKSDLVVYSGAGLEPWIDGYDFKNKAIGASNVVCVELVVSSELKCLTNCVIAFPFPLPIPKLFCCLLFIRTPNAKLKYAEASQ